VEQGTPIDATKFSITWQPKNINRLKNVLDSISPKKLGCSPATPDGLVMEPTSIEKVFEDLKCFEQRCASISPEYLLRQIGQIGLNVQCMMPANM
jgi:hypothetical protein